MNTDVKSIIASKTLWGVIVAALPTVLGFFGFQIADLTAFTAGSETAINEIFTLVGSIVAVYGRVTATKALVVKKAKV